MPKTNINGEEIGSITHYFSGIGVAVVALSSDLKHGDRIRIKGRSTDFEQDVDSMQIDGQTIQDAQVGQEIGLKVEEKVKEGDKAYKL